MALEAGDGLPVAPADRDAVDEVGQHRELHAGFTERGQHLLDVGEEQPVGPDDQHALVLEREPVGVEEVGGAVQGDDRLAGARPALHHQHARERRADDLVLLALDGGDDVAHAAGPGRLQRGDEGAVALQAGSFAQVERVLAEELVLDPEQLAAARGEVPAAGQAHRVTAGRPVEGLGHRRPPVDHHRLLPPVRHGQAPDVEGLAAVVGVTIDAAEQQRRVAQVELGQPVGDGVEDDVALEASLLGAALAHLDHALQPVRRRARLLEAVVRTVDVGLLSSQVGMDRHGGGAVLKVGGTPFQGIRKLSPGSTPSDRSSSADVAVSHRRPRRSP